jgi:hypothetical protein
MSDLFNGYWNLGRVDPCDCLFLLFAGWRVPSTISRDKEPVILVLIIPVSAEISGLQCTGRTVILSKANGPYFFG